MIDLETLAARFNVQVFPGVYRPLKPFLLQLADLYLFLDERVPCLHWFNGEKNVLYIAIGADGAPFGRNDTATAYLVSILNLLQRVQSCNDNHLLMGSNSPDDSPLMKHYTDHLSREMEEVDRQQLTTPRGYQITFRMKLIPCDMNWSSSMSGELKNCASYFSPFANVNQNTKQQWMGQLVVLMTHGKNESMRRELQQPKKLKH
ncbi:hypothetical protein ABFA07_018667 [Porites harrisoni]